MESLDVDVIGDAANFLLEAPREDNGDGIPQQAEQVAAIWEEDLADFEDANVAVVEAEDVDIIDKASHTYIDGYTIVDDNNALLEVLCKDNEAEAILQAADFIDDLAEFEGARIHRFYGTGRQSLTVRRNTKIINGEGDRHGVCEQGQKMNNNPGSNRGEIH